jgi:hypothetical protein
LDMAWRSAPSVERMGRVRADIGPEGLHGQDRFGGRSVDRSEACLANGLDCWSSFLDTRGANWAGGPVRSPDSRKWRRFLG